MCGVFQKGYALVGKIEEDHCSAQDSRFTKHIHVHQVADAYKHKDEHLAADSFEAHFA